MIIQFHTPDGVVDIDTEEVTDTELSLINMTREEFDMFLSNQPRDLLAEIDELKATYDADADGRIERDALEWAAGKLLRGAGEGVDPVLIDVPSVKSMATGTYTGNASGGRQITTGFKCNLIMIVNTTNYSYSGYILPGGSIALFSSPAPGGGTLHGTNGFVLDGTHLNRNNHVYYYLAISE